VAADTVAEAVSNSSDVVANDDVDEECPSEVNDIIDGDIREMIMC